MAIGCFICVNISLVIVLIGISNFVMSGGILFKMLVLGINEMVSCLSSEVLKGYSLFFIYKTNLFVKLLKLWGGGGKGCVFTGSLLQRILDEQVRKLCFFTAFHFDVGYLIVK